MSGSILAKRVASLAEGLGEATCVSGARRGAAVDAGPVTRQPAGPSEVPTVMRRTWHDDPVMSPRVAIVDDHPAILDGAEAALRRGLPTVEIVVAGSTAAALDGLGSDQLDVVVLDVSLGDGSDPPTIVADLVRRDLGVLLYTQDTRRGLIARCFQAGAAGIVPKRADVAVLVEAVLTVAAGEPYLSPEWALALYGDDLWGVPRLAPREAEALKLYAAGLPLKLVARRMGISQETAREYLLRLRRKYAEVGRDGGTKTALYYLAVEDGHLPEGRPDWP